VLVGRWEEAGGKRRRGLHGVAAARVDEDNIWKYRHTSGFTELAGDLSVISPASRLQVNNDVRDLISG
jgi:hypothetical protein